MKGNLLLIIIIFSSTFFGQCPKTKYGIVPVWPQNWTFADKENWYQTMSNKGMGYLHSIYTWYELDQIISNELLKNHVDYIQHLKDDYGFTYHLLLRNPSLTYNAVPMEYEGMTFNDTTLTNAFYNFSVSMIDSFANVLEYLTIGGESDHYFELYPSEMEGFVNVFSNLANYVHTNYPHIKFASTITLYHGLFENDTLWQSTKAFSDMLSVTYWPLDQNFTVLPTAISDMSQIISDLVNAAEGKPIIIKEAGLPSSTITNSSEQLQAHFAEELFRNTIDIDQIKIVGWDFLADYNQETIDYWVNFQQIHTPEFRAYIGSLGLLDTLGNPKPAYSSYLNKLDSLCNITSIKNYEYLDNSMVYPNPSNGLFKIQLDNLIKVQVYDIQGKMILESKSNFINLEKSASGTYILKIFSDEKEITKKLILLK